MIRILDIIVLDLLCILCLIYSFDCTPLASFPAPFSKIAVRGDRDCDPGGSEFGKSMTDCRKKAYLKENGDCGGDFPAPGHEGACSAYCEIRITYKHGQELPFNSGDCSTTQCTIEKGKTTSSTTTWEINANVGIEAGEEGLMGAFNLGASYSFSTTVTYSMTAGQTQTLEKGDCGYWTWVPVLVESCGTLSIAPSSPMLDGPHMGGSMCIIDELTNVANWCNTTPLYTDGEARGDIIFVFKNCNAGGGVNWTHPDLDAIYKVPGVSTANNAQAFWDSQAAPAPS